jgi:hypothetical protein
MSLPKCIHCLRDPWNWHALQHELSVSFSPNWPLETCGVEKGIWLSHFFKRSKTTETKSRSTFPETRSTSAQNDITPPPRKRFNIPYNFAIVEDRDRSHRESWSDWQCCIKYIILKSSQFCMIVSWNTTQVMQSELWKEIKLSRNSFRESLVKQNNNHTWMQLLAFSLDTSPDDTVWDIGDMWNPFITTSESVARLRVVLKKAISYKGNTWFCRIYYTHKTSKKAWVSLSILAWQTWLDQSQFLVRRAGTGLLQSVHSRSPISSISWKSVESVFRWCKLFTKAKLESIKVMCFVAVLWSSFVHGERIWWIGCHSKTMKVRSDDNRLTSLFLYRHRTGIKITASEVQTTQCRMDCIISKSWSFPQMRKSFPHLLWWSMWRPWIISLGWKWSQESRFSFFLDHEVGQIWLSLYLMSSSDMRKGKETTIECWKELHEVNRTQLQRRNHVSHALMDSRKVFVSWISWLNSLNKSRILQIESLIQG